MANTQGAKEGFSRVPSALDASVNLVRAADDGGFYEARLVQRAPDKFICYLSSHSGCAYSCRFCHLTATGQTMMLPETMPGYLSQAMRVMEEYDTRVEGGQARAARVNFNFMARGEPLDNPVVLSQAPALWQALVDMARERGLSAKIKVSSIIPADFSGSLDDVFCRPEVELYYSLYSLDPAFRRRWLPKSMDPMRALDKIAHWQNGRADRRLVLHGAFIKDHNDSIQGVHDICRALDERGIMARFNLVRYNPHDQRHGLEADEARLDDLLHAMSEGLRDPGCNLGPSKMIPRVGQDVAASCGMFITADDPRL